MVFLINLDTIDISMSVPLFPSELAVLPERGFGLTIAGECRTISTEKLSAREKHLGMGSVVSQLCLMK